MCSRMLDFEESMFDVIVLDCILVRNKTTDCVKIVGETSINRSAYVVSGDLHNVLI